MEQIASILTGLAKKSGGYQMLCKPSIFSLADNDDRNEVEEILLKPGIKVFDELHGQLKELVKSKHPTRKFKPAELDAAAIEYLTGMPSEEYGVWVFYPWLNYLVHILDKVEFRSVRTNRNQYKITPEERDILATKKIGVLGLSVGQAVALALSMERSFGELRIADFDMLELSNLNRIRSGVQDLGLLKTVSTARQIAEIDPFLDVKCFHEGLNEQNLESFFLDGGKLDIIIDECDGLDVKILARHKAKELRVPVVMETSDRGMLDIERFDLEPNRSIMHGLIDHLDLNPKNLKGLTNEEKIPYILPMLGLDTMSDRLKASMLEVEQSVTTWPQLASDVILGGAISANVCRRIALDQLRVSGRFFVDMNEIVSVENSHQFITEEAEMTPVPASGMEEVVVSKQRTDKNQLNLSKQQVSALVEAAITAPSGCNSQPWRFVYENRNLLMILDNSRLSSFLDFVDSASFLALGAATENIILKAHEMGFEVSIDEFPESGNKKLVGVFRFYNNKAAGAPLAEHSFDFLANTITKRLTNRLLRPRKKIEPKLLEEIQNAGQSITGAVVKMVEDEQAIYRIGELMAKVDRLLITHEEGHHGFVNELRWTDTEARQKKDGLDIATIDLTAGEAAGFRIAKSWSVVKTLNTWGGGSVFEKLSRKGAACASAMGLISMPGSNEKNYFDSGKSMERLWLFANYKGISFQPMTALTFMLHRLVHGKGESLTAGNIKDLNIIRDEFYQLFNLTSKEHPVILFRLLVAEEPKVKSQRIPVEEVLVYKP